MKDYSPIRLRWTAALLACLWLCSGVRADSLAAPTLAHWSANRQFVLRVDWRSGMLALRRVTGGEEKPLWRVHSPIDTIPNTAYIRDDGRFVVLRDSYEHRGRGKALAFLGDHGQTLHIYALSDLFSESETIAIPESVSSTNWSSPGLFCFLPNGDRFGFITYWGRLGLFDLNTGARLPRQASDEDAFRAYALTIERRDLSDGKSGDIDRGVMLAGVLKDRESLPILKSLLRDPSHCTLITGTGSDTTQSDYFGMQLQAGKALVRILGREAAPLIEERLATANTEMASSWIDLLQSTGAAAHSPALQRYTRSADSNLRFAAITAIIANGGIAVVHRHPEWLRDRSNDIRYRATRCLSEFGDNRDLPVLRRQLQDKEEIVFLWAFRGIDRLAPPDLDMLLRLSLHLHPDQEEVRMALADRGDARQLKWCVDQMTRSVNSMSDSVSSDRLQDIARILVRRRPAGTKALLTRVAHMPGNHYEDQSSFQSVGYGGLAALGDTSALATVRRLATKWDVFTATQAIEWLAICRDRASLPLLRSLLDSPDALTRATAKAAIQAINEPPSDRSIEIFDSLKLQENPDPDMETAF